MKIVVVGGDIKPWFLITADNLNSLEELVKELNFIPM